MDKELSRYIKESKKIGIKDGEIKQNLLNGGWDAEVINDAFKDFVHTKYNPWLMAISNIIVPGGAYLVLGVYSHFYVMYGIIVAAFFVPYLFWVVIPVAIIDTFVQTKKVNYGERTYTTNKILTTIGILTFFAVLLLSITASRYITLLPIPCDYLHPFNKTARYSCKMNKAEYQIDINVNKSHENWLQLQKGKIVDANCDAWRSDPRLQKSVQYTGTDYVGTAHYDSEFVFACYLKRAVENKNPNYCLSDNVYSEDCIKRLAMKLNRTSICDDYLSDEHTQKECYEVVAVYNKEPALCGKYTGIGGIKESCEATIEICQKANWNSELSGYYRSLCRGDVEELLTCKQSNAEVKELCEEEFGDFFRSF